MNEFSQISSASVFPVDRGRGLRYLIGGFAANSVLWGIAWLLLQEAPRIYTSQWSYILADGTPSVGMKQGPNSVTSDHSSSTLR